MKRLTIIVFSLIITLNIFAQEENPQYLGVQLGFDRSILRTNNAKHEEEISTLTAMNGVKVGLVYDATLAKGFGFSLGLNYSFDHVKGKWEKGTGLAGYTDKREQRLMHSIEVPIDWQYKIAIAKETWVILYTGPTIEYNFIFNERTDYKRLVPGTTKIEENHTNISHYAVDQDNDGKMDYTPLNITWGLGIGFQFQKYYIRGGYDFGIYNPYKDRSWNVNNDLQYTNRGRFDGWNIKVGLYFLEF